MRNLEELFIYCRISVVILAKKYRGREIKDAVDFANILLEAVLVALVPGEAFNIKGKVRLSYSNSMENLKEAMDRIQTFVRELE